MFGSRLSRCSITSGRGEAGGVGVLGTCDADVSDVVEMSSAPREDVDISGFCGVLGYFMC